MGTYRVRAYRFEAGWELHVDGYGVTQVADLAEAERQVREYLETLTDAPATGEVVVRPTYRVLAERDGDWWAIKVPDVRHAFTQARDVDGIEAMARDVVALLLEVPEDSFDLQVETRGA